MDIQPVFDEYKTMTYMCPYFSGSKVQFSQAMKEAAKKAFKNNLYHYETM